MLSALKSKCGLACCFIPAVVIISAIWILAYNFSIKSDRSEYEKRKSVSEELAENLSGALRDVIRYGDHYALAVRRDYIESNGSVDTIDHLIGIMPYDLEKLSHITVLNANGEPVFNSGGKIIPGVHARDRAYFRYIRDHETDDVYIVPIRLTPTPTTSSVGFKRIGGGCGRSRPR